MFNSWNLDCEPGFHGVFFEKQQLPEDCCFAKTP